jgi:hypothetical protein
VQHVHSQDRSIVVHNPSRNRIGDRFRDPVVAILLPGGALMSSADRPRHRSSDKRPTQSQRIRELRLALIEAGCVSLDQQAAVLGLSRSTTWAILRGNPTCTGLPPALIARMLRAPKLPQAARAVLMNYVSEKSQGAYGHSDVQRERLTAQLKRHGLL